MSKAVYALAKKNYPDLWNKGMIDHLHEIGRLTDEEYEKIIKEEEEEGQE